MNSASLAGCSILICEDEPLIALSIADAFTGAGARVSTVRSLARALIAIDDEVPSAVILDHALSDGESSQLCKRLKERNVPYVIHSGYSDLVEPMATRCRCRNQLILMCSWPRFWASCNVGVVPLFISIYDKRI